MSYKANLKDPSRRQRILDRRLKKAHLPDAYIVQGEGYKKKRVSLITIAKRYYKQTSSGLHHENYPTGTVAKWLSGVKG